MKEQVKTNEQDDAVGTAPRWQFSLRTLMLGCLAAGILCAPPCYLGWMGVGCSFLLVLSAVVIWCVRSGRLTLVEFLVVVVLAGIVVAMMLPAVQTTCTNPAGLTNCRNNLKMIWLGLLTYRQTNGAFPPPYLTDEDGKPMHSWRTLLLPYLEHENLYKQINLDEPWDSPANAQLAGTVLNVYGCPDDPARKAGRVSDTSYVAVVGPNTLWRPPVASGSSAAQRQQGVAESQITDDPGATLLIVEMHNSGIPWMAPRDLDISSLPMQINPKTGRGVNSSHAGGAVAAFADGSVHMLPADLTAKTLKAMLTANGGETINPDDF